MSSSTPHRRRTLPHRWHYIVLSSTPPIPDALSARKTVHDALTASFGLVHASTPVDVLSHSSSADEDGGRTILRTSSRDAARVMAAAVAFSGPGKPRLCAVADAPFLPALAVVGRPPIF